MSPTKRIVLNVVVSYARSLFALFVGLFTIRWILIALGDVNYGLYGLVGGLTTFMTFLNEILSIAVSRFYGVSVGLAKKDWTSGLEVCRQWFSTAVMLHTVVPVLLIMIGYPIGVWAIREFLNIPLDRVEASIWVWRFACLNCFCMMASVPYSAMFTAKQEIAEVTLYSFLSTTLTFVLAWYMVSHPGDWLVRYSGLTCGIAVLPQVLIFFRAKSAYPECQIKLKYLFDWGRVRQLLSFAGWQTFGSFGSLLKWQGIAILINKYYGAEINAASTIARGISGKCDSLSNSLLHAFSPAVMNAYGSGNLEYAKRLAFQACKFCTICSLAFAIPMIIEIRELLWLWLKRPPPYVEGLSICVIISVVVHKISYGHHMMVYAKGNIALFQAVLGTSILMTFPVAWILMAMGIGPYSAGYAIALMVLVCAIGRVVLARKLVGMSVRYWFLRIFLPVIAVTLVCGLVGTATLFIMRPSLLRIVITTSLVEMLLLPLSWFWVFDADEKNFIRSKISHITSRIKI